jgi:hypothetical protein
MLLIVISALCFALSVQEWRHLVRERQLEIEIMKLKYEQLMPKPIIYPTPSGNASALPKTTGTEESSAPEGSLLPVQTEQAPEP